MLLRDVVVHLQADKPDPPRLDKVRYSAHLPWIGPILGPSPGKANIVTVGGASDPVLGNALAVVFIPVRKRGAGYEPADRHGRKADIVEVAWFAWLKSDGDGRFRVHPEAGLWDGAGDKTDGVWMLLLYERSGSVGHQIDMLSKLPASDVPPEMTGPIRERMAKPDDPDPDRALINLVPAPAPDTLAFAVGSCQYPAGFLDRDVAEGSYRRLAMRLGEADPPSCVLLLGDQVYLDATAGLFDPTAVYDKYHRPYERLLQMAPLRHVLRRIPAHMMLDDHEIEDNWQPLEGDRQNHDKLVAGRNAYVSYQRIAGPDPGGNGKQLWHDFDVQGFPFFMTDTRTERDPRTAATIATARIMSDVQRDHLLQWLSDETKAGKPKFVASSVSLLPRHRRTSCAPACALHSDSWEGYPASLHHLLSWIVEHELKNVVFLSGDEHMSFVARAALRRKDRAKATVIHSIHSSALYAPFPFANAIEDQLHWPDQFDFAFEGVAYECEVSRCCATAKDGVTVLQARKEGNEWMLDYTFLSAGLEFDERRPIYISR